MHGSLFSFLRLCRFPTVFTALADICAGFLLSHAALVPGQEFLCLLAASAGIYLSGMVFNDVFDLQQDARERPQRPIPSGAVSLKSAILFGSALLCGGVLAAGLAGSNSLGIALILAGTVLAYDGFFKRTPLGPIAMGSCRFFNILLGASSAGTRFAAAFQMPQLWMAIAMGVYIVGVTWFARTEARQSRGRSLLAALATINLGLALLLVWILNVSTGVGLMIGPGALASPWPVLFLWGVVTLTINRRGLAAVFDPIPGRVQGAVGVMLLSVISLDAMMIYFKLGPAGIPYAAGTLALLVPAVLLRRWIPLT